MKDKQDIVSVRPDATRNSSSPYCNAFRHWMRKVAKSIRERIDSSTAEQSEGAPQATAAEPALPGRWRCPPWGEGAQRLRGGGQFIVQPRPGSDSPLAAMPIDLFSLPTT